MTSNATPLNLFGRRFRVIARDFGDRTAARDEAVRLLSSWLGALRIEAVTALHAELLAHQARDRLAPGPVPPDPAEIPCREAVRAVAGAVRGGRRPSLQLCAVGKEEGP